MAKQDQHRAAVEAYDDCKEQWQENHARMLEDLRFSNPADPQQWDAVSRKLRQGRIMHTHDRTNQYKQAVVNQARRGKPGILTSPADSGADIEVAKRIDGVIRHIEYSSRAHIAYDWAIGGAADCGIGWIRVTPRVIKQHSNQQEWRIERVLDHLSIVCDGNEPDGSDMMHGFAETLISKAQFKRDYPKADMSAWNGDAARWVRGDYLVICEHQYVVETPETWVTISNPETEEELDLSVADYGELVASIGFSPPVLREFKTAKRKVMWQKLGADLLEDETEFPSQWIGMVPVLGYETVVEGKRYICGLTRRLMDSQRDYNFQRSAGTEAIALQPKAPLMAAMEAMEGHSKHYETLNEGSPALLPFNAFDNDGRAIPQPSRLSPPSIPAAYNDGARMALSDMEAAIGMLRTSGDAPPASASGRALRERKDSADVATFHFPDNQSNSIEQVGRILVSGLPRLYDTKRVARIIGEEGRHDSVTVDPEMGDAVARDRAGKVIAINFGVGEYDVRIKTGPSYTSQRESAAEGIEQILSAAPNFTAVLGPQLVKLRDFPDADKTARMMIATLPPEMQAIYNEGDDGSPESKNQEIQSLQNQIKQMQQQMQQMGQMLDAGEQELKRLEQDSQAKQADIMLKQAEMQFKAQDMELRAREVAIKEQDAELRVLEARAKATHAQDKEILNAELQTKRDEIEAYKAETDRMRMEQDGLAAERNAQLQAATTIVQTQGETDPLQRIMALEEAIEALHAQILGQSMPIEEAEPEDGIMPMPQQ